MFPQREKPRSLGEACSITCQASLYTGHNLKVMTQNAPDLVFLRSVGTSSCAVGPGARTGRGRFWGRYSPWARCACRAKPTGTGPFCEEKHISTSERDSAFELRDWAPRPRPEPSPSRRHVHTDACLPRHPHPHPHTHRSAPAASFPPRPGSRRPPALPEQPRAAPRARPRPGLAAHPGACMRPMMAAEQSGQKERPRPPASAGSAGPAPGPAPNLGSQSAAPGQSGARPLSPPAPFPHRAGHALGFVPE